MSTFDRDARELAKDAIAFYSRYANPLLLDALIDAARWAVEVTEGDGRVVEIVTECKHGKSDPHRWEPSTSISDEGWCPGGSRRVLEPGELVDLIDKHTQAIIDSLGLKNLTVAPGASVVSDLGLPLDALPEGEQ